MFPTFLKMGILIDFKINQDFISEVLCINKEKTAKTCKGSCYLSEQIKRTQEQEDKQIPHNNKERLQVVYFQSKTIFNFFGLSDKSITTFGSAYQDGFFASSFITDIFHPPKLILT